MLNMSVTHHFTRLTYSNCQEIELRILSNGAQDSIAGVGSGCSNVRCSSFWKIPNSGDAKKIPKMLRV